MNLDPKKSYTIAPVQPAEGVPPKPEFIRLPKPGKQCPYTGLTRAYLNMLVLPNKGNGWNPPVKSVSLRPKGSQRGVRLIHYGSLIAFLYQRMAEDTNESPKGDTP